MLDWSDLLPDLLEKIIKKLTFYEDFISFLCVCTSWRSLATKNHPLLRLLPSKFPSLMLGESEHHPTTRKLFLLSNGGVIRNINLPEAHDQRCISSGGWLLTTGDEEFAAKLIHPLSRLQIALPDLYMFPELYFDQDEWIYYGNSMKKFVFTCSNININPLALHENESFRVVIIWGNTIGVCRPGDVSWTRIDHRNWEGGNLLDIAYHKTREKLYVLSSTFSIYEYDVLEESDFRRVTSFPNQEFGSPESSSAYLLEFGDNGLLMVTGEREHLTRTSDEYRRYGPYKTKRFQAFLFGLEDGDWSKLESLGSNAVFVGSNSCFSVDVSGDGRCPVKGDCVYFTDDVYDVYRGLPTGGGRDVGVYDMSNGWIEQVFDPQEEMSSVGPGLWLESSVSFHVQ